MPNTGPILRSSYDAVPSKSRLYDRFYTLLFERYPEVRPLFPPDLKALREQLAAAVSALVMNAEQFGALEPMLRELGERHVRYGAQEAHYPIVADLLRGAPGLKAVVTSRATLRVSGEQEYEVPGLPTPPDPSHLSGMERLSLPGENRTLDADSLGQYAADPELTFSWYDAAMMSQRIAKLRSSAAPKSSQTRPRFRSEPATEQ